MCDETRFKIRFIKVDEAKRLAELILALQQFQNLQGAARIPTEEDIVNELFHRDANGKLVPHNLGTHIAVAIDLTKLHDDVNKSYIVGYIIYTQSFSITHGRSMYLTSFFIEEDYRRHGLGKKFIKFMRVHAELLGNDRFDVPFMKENLVAKKFYTSLGAYLVDEDYMLAAKAI